MASIDQFAEAGASCCDRQAGGILDVLRAIAACGVVLTGTAAHGGLLTNFAGSYAQYQACTNQVADFDGNLRVDGSDFLSWQGGRGLVGQLDALRGDADRDSNVTGLDFDLWKAQFGGAVTLSNSVCFKLYFDPAGIIEGQTTAFVEVLDPGGARFDLSEVSIINRSSEYSVSLFGAPTVITGGGVQRIEQKVHFNAINPTNPPTTAVQIFGLQFGDMLPLETLDDVSVGFKFISGDFITTFDPLGVPPIVTTTLIPPTFIDLDVPLILDVNTVSGAVSIRNNEDHAVSFSYYDVTSAAGSLSPGGWVSIDDNEGGDPPGVGWDEGGGITTQSLVESNFLGSLQLTPGDTQPLGLAYNATTGARDLVFHYTTSDNQFRTGVINYNTTSSAAAIPEPRAGALAGMALAGGVQVQLGFARRRRFRRRR